jgi:hypothetical protein
VELRITARCWEEDLTLSADHDALAEVSQSHPIVSKFLALRSQSPAGQEIFRQATSRPDIYTLHAGQLRGVTWHDKEYYVIWLLGFATHRAGHHSDAYKVLAELDQKEGLLPTVTDYEALLRDRAAREIPEMVFKIRSLLAQARAEPEKFHSTLVRDGVRVRLCVIQAVDSTGAVEEFRLAISAYHLEPGWMDIIRTTLWPFEETEGWQFTDNFPELPPSKTELLFTHWHPMEPEAGSP